MSSNNEVDAAQDKALKSVANYLLSHKQSQLRNRPAILNGRRVEYFKGQSAVKSLLRPAYTHASRPPVSTREEAEEVLHTLLVNQYFLRVHRGEPTNDGAGPRVLQLEQRQSFDEDAYFVWVYQGSQLYATLGGFALIGIVFAGVMFPLWPEFMRDGAWYISVLILGFLGFLFVTAIIRLIFYVITLVVMPKAIWIFPNLFEDVGFFESFVPLWAWDEPKKKKGKKSKRDDGTSAGEESSTSHTAGIDSDRKDE